MTIDRIRISTPRIDRSQQVSGKEIDQAGNTLDRVAPEDSLSLSSVSKEIDRIATTIEQSRIDRLNEVKKALDVGKYHVAADDLARKMIDSNKL
jgi:anti-sigma28 factor (negative regulator of flagellin synthesis)